MKTREIRIERELNASIERVFEAWTHAKSLSQWMAPGEVGCSEVECEPRVGGRFRIVMQGEDCYVHTGEYLVVDPPHRLVFTWTSNRLPDVATQVTVTLAERDGKTHLTLHHQEVPEGSAYQGYDGGWQSILDKLAVSVA